MRELQERVSTLKAELESSGSKNVAQAKSAQSAISAANKDITELKNALEEAHQANASLATKLASADALAQTLREESETKTEQFNQRIGNLEASLEDERQKLAEAKAMKDEGIEASKDALRAIETAATNAKAEKEAAEKQAAQELSEAIMKTKQDMESRFTEMMKEKMAAAEKARAMLQEKVEDLEAKSKSQQDEFRVLQEGLENRHMLALQNMRGECNDEEKRRKDAEDALAKVQEQLKSKEEQLKRCQDTVRAKQKQLEAMAGQPGQQPTSASKKDAAIRRRKRKSGQFSKSGEAVLDRENSTDGINQESEPEVEEDGAASKAAAEACAETDATKKTQKKKKKRGKKFTFFSPRITRSRAGSK